MTTTLQAFFPADAVSAGMSVVPGAPNSGMVYLYETGTAYLCGTAPELAVGQAQVTANVGFLTNGPPINQGTAPVGVTFTTTLWMYQKIMSEQCVRTSSLIFESLGQLDYENDDYNEQVVERIADAIDLVGEPAYCTALLEARHLQDRFAFGYLLLGIASSKSKETETHRLRTLCGYTEDSDYRTRRAAVRALGRMGAAGAKQALREISENAAHGEIAQMARAFL